MTTVATSEEAPQLPPAVPLMSNADFRALANPRSRELLRLAQYLDRRHWKSSALTRPLLGEIFHQATYLEELLDAYGARYNERWRPYRATMAAAKLFAGVNYVLLHIQHSLPAYRLLPVEGDFVAATAEAVEFSGQVLLRIGRRMLLQARQLELDAPPGDNRDEEWEESLPPGRLAHNRKGHRAVDASETVTYLATAFLNQAAGSELLHVPMRIRPSEYLRCVPETVSEEEVRRLQHQFHNLQSLYDTFVSDTDTERLNPDLPVLRGHISVIFHLLETATGFAHYYERHVMGNTARLPEGRVPLVDGRQLIDYLMRYSLSFASRFLTAGRELCQKMLKRYAEIGRVEVAGPRYRGFHVRPATLVAKIVCHYGSKVSMELAGDSFDASSPMDIFRANEKINREKRAWLSAEVDKLPCIREAEFFSDPCQAVRRVVFTLAEQGKIVIYQRPLPARSPEESDAYKDPLQYVLDEVKRLQTTGVIDIETEITVAFVGDKRVLKDLRLLAGCGYGEDHFGNNTPLPKEIAYLRRGQV